MIPLPGLCEFNVVICLFPGQVVVEIADQIIYIDGPTSDKNGGNVHKYLKISLMKDYNFIFTV